MLCLARHLLIADVSAKIDVILIIRKYSGQQ